MIEIFTVSSTVLTRLRNVSIMNLCPDHTQADGGVEVVFPLSDVPQLTFLTYVCFCVVGVSENAKYASNKFSNKPQEMRVCDNVTQIG